MNQDAERLERQLLEKERKTYRVHLRYGAIIFLLLGVFLIVIAPGSVNPKAFENFSFASTIVSIVLAVVSIIYSFTVGKSTGDNIVGIREIEHRIDSKLERFDAWKDQILDGVRSMTSPIGEEVGRLHEDQIGFREEMTRMMSKINMKTNSASSEVIDQSSSKVGDAAFYGNLSMYISVLSKKSNKPFDLSELGVSVSIDYIWGFMEACSAVFPAAFSYSVKEKEFTIIKYDKKVLGDESLWRDRIMRYADQKEAESYLKAIDSYFGGTLNLSSDSQK